MARGKKEAEEPGEEVQRPGAEGFGFLVLANAYRRAMEYGQARQVCLEGLKHHPDYLSARMALAVILMESGETEEAQAELEAVIEAAPSNILARRLLGNLYQEAANVAEAKKQFEEILWLFPGHEEALKSLAGLDEMAAAAGSGEAPPAETDETEALDETFVDEVPATVEAPSEEESAAKSPMETVSEESPFTELADMDESEPLDTRTLARLYEEQGRHGDALATYKKILEDSPDDDEIRNKVEELVQLQGIREKMEESVVSVDSLIAEEEKEEEPPAAEEKPLGQAGQGSPEDEEALVDLGLLDLRDEERGDDAGPGTDLSVAEAEEEPASSSEITDEEDRLAGELEDLLVLEKESLAKEDPAEIKEPPSEESPEWMSGVEDIGSDLGAKPDLEVETSVEDREPDHAPAQGGVEISSVPAGPDGPEEPAPDEPASGKEEAIDRLENLLQKIRTMKNDPP